MAMNDLEFQKQAIANPYSTDPEFLRAAEQSPARERHLERQKQLHDEMAQAMRDVPVPEGLSERILLKHSIKKRHTWRHWRKRIALILGASLALFFLSFRATQPAVAGMVFEHLEHDHSGATLYRVTQLPALMSEFGSTFIFDDSLKVLNVMPCDINQKQGLHFEVLGPGGLFVVVVMPDDHVKREKTVEHNGMTANLYPWGKGTVAVVGRNAKKIDNISQHLLQMMPVANV